MKGKGVLESIERSCTLADTMGRDDYSKRSRGRPAINFIDKLEAETGIGNHELDRPNDRDGWR